ncbi:MAG: TonB-dependent receptor [Prolixibacteraceae bacterium]|jgi:vitamin B12 transporter|nr:TonB-dependent receptor [Prolixibacteraceae bacterium]
MKKQINLKTSSLVFRRWNSKGYAVFNSLNKAIVIGCLMVAYLLFVNPTNATAQEDSTAVTKSYDLESIDINSDQLPETYSSISRVVVTITKSEIERAAVTSVNELLEYASNVDIRQRGTNGIQADISIRGGSFDQVLVLLNGVNITDPQTGHHNLNLPLDLSSVERIEILKGPGAWKFGPGAFSGAINIITSTSSNNFITVGAELGQFNSNSENITSGLKIKNTTHLLAVNHSSTNGYTDNTDHSIKNLFYHGKLVAGKTEFSMQAGASDKGFGANSFYTAKYPNQYEEIQTYFVSAGIKTQLKNLQIEPKIYYRRNNDRFVLFRTNPASWYKNDNYHTSEVLGVNALANYIHGTNATTTLGADFRNETIYSNNLGEVVENTIQSPVNDTITLNRFHTRSNFSAFIGHKHYFENLMVNVGLNVTHNSDLKSKWFLFPGVDLNYTLNKNYSLFASVNKTMRMPTYTDLYYQGPSNEGNTNLLPEEAIGYELGFKYEHKLANFTLTGFHIQGSNMIDWVRNTTEEKWRTINHTELNTTGFEVSLQTDLEKIVPEQNLFKGLRLSYTNVYQNKVETELISNYSLNYLKHRLDVSLNHSVWKNISASWHFAFQDRNGEYLKYENSQSVGMKDYEPFSTTDIKIIWNHAGWKIYASLNNIFDVEYYDIGNVQQPGRWIKVGVSKRFNFN